MDKNTIQKRFSFKLGSSAFSLIANIIIQLFVPRTLGAIAYGNFNFLTTFFQQIIGFFNLWITPAYYVKLSQRPKEFGLIAFTIYYILASVIIIVGFIIISIKRDWGSILLPDQEFFIITLAMLFAIFLWIVQILTGISDAFKITIQAEKNRVFFRIVGLVLFILLLATNNLNLKNFFYYNFTVSILISLSFISVIRRNENFNSHWWIISKSKTKSYFKEFSKYSNPLIISGGISIISIILDRWFLQFFWGSKEQAFFGISQQIGIICFLFTGSMTTLLIREFSVAYRENNIVKIASDFRKYIPLLYTISAYFASFVVVQAKSVVEIIGGGEYSQAVIVVTIMSFYPIHQTYGQLSGAVFLATNRTKLYSVISIVLTLIGFVLSFFLIAPSQYYGLALGAKGLAIKMVLIQIVSVTIQLAYNSKYLNLVLWKYLFHQILVVFVLISLAALSQFLINQIGILKNIYVIFICNGVLYSITVVILLFYEPRIFGLNQQSIKSLRNSIKNVVS